MSVQSINPTTGAAIATYEEHTDDEIARALDRSRDAFPGWRALGFAARADRLCEAAGLLKKNRAEYAELITIEMGKPVLQAVAELDKSILGLEYYARHGAAFLADEAPPEAPGLRDFVTYEPLGAILAVMPWNYPFWQVLRTAAPALMAGNVVLLKHAANVTGCAFRVEQLLLEAGFPPGVFQTLVVDSSRVGRIIADPAVRGVSLTGSSQAGRRIGEAAGRALKPVLLELGGSDPYLILKDANLDRAVPLCAQARLNNNGQSCVAGKRFIVEKAIRAGFEKRFVEHMARTIVGDPLSEETELGPLAREDIRDGLHAQVQASLQAGADLLLGGEIPDRPGWFYPATVLGGIRPGIPAYDQELFGPVASLIEAVDEQDAIRIANDTSFGLGGGVFSDDVDRAIKVARQIETGAVFINDFVRSHPALPFGGVKDSGFGRELGRPGIMAFVSSKTISVA